MVFPDQHGQKIFFLGMNQLVRFPKIHGVNDGTKQTKRKPALPGRRGTRRGRRNIGQTMVDVENTMFRRGLKFDDSGKDH